MRQYDIIVVGSGISGLTLALLFGMNGHSVLLLEKNPRIGGSLARFYKQGIPFDTGFHFTGGFSEDGVFHNMLSVLGIQDFIRPIFIEHERNNRFFFEEEKAEFVIPPGIGATKERFKEYFPGEEDAIERYFHLVRDICQRTTALDLRNISMLPNFIDEDYVSLQDVLDGLTGNRMLKSLMAAYSMCYGVKASEISFANHCRVSCALYESVARIQGGGDAVIKAFEAQLAKFNVEIACKTYIEKCDEVESRRVRRFLLNTGEDISCRYCIFTIHPQHILGLLPREHLSRAFVDRLNGFESSASFFAVFGTVEDDTLEEFSPSLLSLFPSSDMERIFDPRSQAPSAMVILRSLEEHKGRRHRVLNGLELSFPEQVRAWKHSRWGTRPPEYSAYKQELTERMRERILSVYPEYRDTFRVVDSASPLTFRDFLNSPDGSAYGIKQKIGQFNLFGRLPLRNLYAAGQSSLLPGLIGAMMSSFIIVRSILGKEPFFQFIESRIRGV